MRGTEEGKANGHLAGNCPSALPEEGAPPRIAAMDGIIPAGHANNPSLPSKVDGENRPIAGEWKGRGGGRNWTRK
jgi:hypothetical protein